jgi:zinc and cadmium transporter
MRDRPGASTTASRGLGRRREPELGAMTSGIVACLVTGTAGLLAAGCLTPRRHLGHGDSWISFAIGALAGTALLDTLPCALGHLGTAHGTLALLLLGAACCFTVDRLFHCRSKGRPHGPHCYADDAHGTVSGRHAGRILLAGDFIHSVVDGSLIVAAFGTDPTLGLLASVAILSHEVPRKYAVILVLVHSGWSRSAALALGALSSLGMVVGGIVAWRALELVNEASPVLLLFAATMMLYVAFVKLLPGIRLGDRAPVTFRQAAFMLSGFVCMSAAHWVAEVGV